MKLLRSAVVGLVVFGFVALFSTVSFAADKEHKEGDHGALIKILKDSAVALQSSRPDLTQGLTKYANDEANEIGGKEEKGEKEDLAEGALVKTLNDSAAALMKSNPDLSKKLSEQANRKAKKIKSIEEKNEKEEKGEKAEPKGDR